MIAMTWYADEHIETYSKDSRQRFYKVVHIIQEQLLLNMSSTTFTSGSNSRQIFTLASIKP
jgi:hypothetical protein